MNKYSIVLIAIVTLLLKSCGNFDGKDGTRVVYFEDTKKIQCKAEYKNGKKNGLYIEFYENGNQRYKTWFENDTIRDSAFFYTEQGKMTSLEIFKKKLKEGCWKKFNSEGVAYSEINFLHGQLHGPAVTYTYKTGRVLARLNYKFDRKDGKQEYFYNNGKPKSVLYFDEDSPCLALEEWYESGEKVNNDFKIFTVEKNKILLENKLIFFFRLENSQPDDRMFEMSETDTGRTITPLRKLDHIGDHFEKEYPVYKGWYVMKKLKVAAYRKTSMGNTMIKTTSVNVSATNY